MKTIKHESKKLKMQTDEIIFPVNGFKESVLMNAHVIHSNL